MLLSVGEQDPIEPLMGSPSVIPLAWFQALLGSYSVCAQVHKGRANASVQASSLSRIFMLVGGFG